MGQAKQKLYEIQEERSNKKLAEILGITFDELSELEWEFDDNSSNDGLVYSFIMRFSENSNKEILKKIDRLEDGLYVYLQPAELEDGEQE